MALPQKTSDFVRLLGADETVPVEHLKPTLGKLYRRALGDLSARAERIEKLMAIGLNGHRQRTEPESA